MPVVTQIRKDGAGTLLIQIPLSKCPGYWLDSGNKAMDKYAKIPAIVKLIFQGLGDKP